MKKKYLSMIAALSLVTGIMAGCTPAAPTDTTTAGTTPAETTSAGTTADTTTADTTAPGTSAEAREFDVVVVGGGAAGLSAAITAAEDGAKVALLEKLGFVGGSTLLSGGIVYGYNSKIHQAAGIEDSVDDLVQYWSDRAQGKNDPAFLRFVAEHSGETIDWVVERGVVFGQTYPTGTSPVARAVSTANGGAGIIKPLEAHAKTLDIEFFMETPATELILTDGAVTGVRAVTKDEEELTFNARAVILSTGGFDHNEDLMKEYAARSVGHHTFAGVGNTGDGLLMAKDAGADIVSNGGTIGFRRVADEPSYTTAISSLMWMPYLSVNKNGERFVNEAIDYPLFYEALIAQPEQISYLIFDGNTFADPLEDAVAKGNAFKGETLEELAQAAGIDPVQFTATVEAYNAMLATGEDKEFGKVVTDHKPIDKASFYALKVEPAILGTMSGVKIDLDTHVLDTAGNPIQGLYAAGEVANGSFFNLEYPASGTSIQMSLTFGRIAGGNAAAGK